MLWLRNQRLRAPGLHLSPGDPPGPQERSAHTGFLSKQTAGPGPGRQVALSLTAVVSQLS